MRGDLTIRKTKTASGAIAVQVVRNIGKRRDIVQHIGSAHDATALRALLAQAQSFVERHCVQPSLFAASATASPLAFDAITLVAITHRFSRDALLACARRCRLGFLPELYLDFALMRIIEPTSKARTITLLQEHFGVLYSAMTVHRYLKVLTTHQEAIENAAIETARVDLQENFHLVLYDVTTLYFESFKDYALQRPGFSKDNKPQQPQIVIGLITTRSGFPVMHEVFKGNTFEGHTMLTILERFQKRLGAHCKPVVVADAAMLSMENVAELHARGYRYIVGARLANLPQTLVQRIDVRMPRLDGSTDRFTHTIGSGKRRLEVELVCHFSNTRHKKDARELGKQIERAQALLARHEPGRRARFVKKSEGQNPFEFNATLKAKAEKLLGIKGYVTNIPSTELSNDEVVRYYHELWNVEQAFRMSKSDLQARPIFHHIELTIKAHMLICFMALMMGKYLEIKTGMSLKRIRDALWRVHEAHLRHESSPAIHIKRIHDKEPQIQTIADALGPEFPH